MVDASTLTDNGAAPAAARQLPAVVHVSQQEMTRVPAPGTLRTLKAQTGREYNELIGGDSSADQFQTFIWAKLRRDIPDLRWEECEDVELVIDATPEQVDRPLSRSESSSTISQRSADSGV